MSVPRTAVAAILLVAPAGFAQIQIDDRPKVLEPAPLTRDELVRQKTEQRLRDALALYAIGVMRQRTEKLVDAAATLEKALSADPESLEVRRTLVLVYAAIGRDEEAMTLCQQVLDRDPTDAETALVYARLLRGDSRPAEAIPVLQRAVAAKEAQARPERLLFMLSDLYDLLEKRGDFSGAAAAQDQIIRTINDKREQLLYGNGFTREDLQSSLARAYERLGSACVRLKEYDRAVAAFRGARDTLLKSDDPAVRQGAVRISRNISEVAAAQGRWADALAALDAYLEYAPADVEAYAKKVEFLRKLGREADVIPALRKYAAREEYNLGLQILLAGELAQDARTRREAERMYTTLLEKNVKPELYRMLFNLYRVDGRMEKVLDLLDQAVRVAKATEDKVSPEAREGAQERAQAMFQVLRSDPPLVAALLPESLAELTRERERAEHTWATLAVLAARARKLDEAEKLFRQSLAAAKGNPAEPQVYVGLIGVLRYRRDYDAIVKLCRDGLTARARLHPVLNIVLHGQLATALAELGQFDEALAHADKAVALSGDDHKVECHGTRARVLAQAGRFADAIRECEDTIRDFPMPNQVREMRYELSSVYSLKGDHARSEEQLRLILETDPDAPLANNNLGYQMADRNVNLDEAERLIRRAIEVEGAIRRATAEGGENAAYIDSLGWVLFRKGRLSEAREWLEKAAALPDGANDPGVWDHLGDVYARLDLAAKAKAAWQTSLKLYDAVPKRNGDPRRAEVEKKIKSLER